MESRFLCNRELPHRLNCGKNLFPILDTVRFHAAGQVYPPWGKLRDGLRKVVRRKTTGENKWAGDAL